MTHKHFRGAVFDFNGTLFFDSHLHEQAWLITAKELTGREPPLAEYYEFMHGRTNEAILAHLLRKVPTREFCLTWGEKKEECYRALCLKESGGAPRLAPGAAELLDDLIAQGIGCAVATSAEISNITFYREVFGLDRWFSDDRLIYNRDGKVKSKPDPELYLRAAAALGLSPGELVMVEDSISGLKGITNAGAGLRVGISPTGREGFDGAEYTDLIISDYGQLDRGLWERNE